MRFALALGGLLAICAASARAEASPEDLFGYGTRSPALAGTGSAWGANAEAAYLNPALLAELRNRQLTLGMYAARFSLAAREGDRALRAAADPARGLLIGAELPLPFRGLLARRIGLGFAFSTPTNLIVRGRVLYPETPQFPVLADRAQALALRVGIGVDLGHGLSVGVGVAALAEIVGSVVVAQDAGGRVASQVDDQLVATYAPTIGVRYLHLLPHGRRLAIGLVVRATLDARFAVTIDASKLSSLKLPLFNIAGVAQYDPAQGQLEASYVQGATIWSVAVGVKLWSRYPGPIEATIPCPAGEEGCGSLVPPDLQARNTVHARASVEHPLLARKDFGFTLRAGVGIETSPLAAALNSSARFDSNAPAAQPTSQVPTRYYDAARATLAGGVELRLGQRVTLGQYVQWQGLVPRTMTPAAAEPTRVSGNVIAVGMSVGATL